MIPKTIYTFWHEEKLPSVIEKCVATWKKHLPDYTINVMSMKNYRKHCPLDVTKHRHYDPKEKARTADMIRLATLRQNGGVWLDASIIMFSSLNPILEKDPNGIVLYAMEFNHPYPVVENWFIACAPNNDFVNAWYDEFINKTATFRTLKEYVEDAEKNMIVRKQWSGVYFTMHDAAQVVLQKRRYPISRMTILDATKGPFEPFDKMKWKNEKVFESLCSSGNAPFPFLKLTGGSRRAFDENKRYQKCIFDRAMGAGSAIEKATATDSSASPVSSVSSVNAVIALIVAVAFIIMVVHFARRSASR